LLIGNDIVLFSGFLQNLTITTNQTYARNILESNSAWRRMDDMPTPIGITHAAILAIGTKVYICGGYIGGHPGPHVPNCFVYDHSAPPGMQQQWSHFTPLPEGGSGGGGMIYDSVRNALFYAGGGQRVVAGSPHPVDIHNTWKFELNDPKSGWVASAPFPYLANHLSYVTHADRFGTERHFFLGGQVGEYECCSNFGLNFEFIASTETWVRRSSMPLPRGHASSSTRAIGCGFIIAGGSVNSENSFKNRTDDISYYDIPTNTWTTGIGSLPERIATPIVDIHKNGYMYFVAGLPSNGQRQIST
jgi:Kelch motif